MTNNLHRQVGNTMSMSLNTVPNYRNHCQNCIIGSKLPIIYSKLTTVYACYTQFRFSNLLYGPSDLQAIVPMQQWEMKALLALTNDPKLLNVLHHVTN